MTDTGDGIALTGNIGTGFMVIMIAMVGGSRGTADNFISGLQFLFDIIDVVPPMRADR